MMFRMLCLTLCVLLLFASTSSASLAGLFVKREDGSYISLADAFVKRQASVPPGTPLRVILQNHNDVAYSATVSMGTPFQDLQMAVSLAQNYILVGTSRTADDIFFKATRSASFGQTAQDPTVPIGLTAGTGPPLTGQIAHEMCKINDFHYNASIVVTPAANNEAIYPDGCSAVLGYGVNPAPEVPADGTLLGSYLPANFTVAECGIQLNRASDGGPGGIFTMGGRDPAGFSGEFQVMTVPAATTESPHPSWSIPLDAVKAGLGAATSSIPGGVASIDPIYPDITLPDTLAKTLYEKLKDAQAVVTSTGTRWRLPCDSKPSLQLTFGGRHFVLDERDAIVKGPDGNCWGAVRSTTDSKAPIKVGANFLRNVYTIFGAEKVGSTAVLTVGFANRATTANTASTTGTGTVVPAGAGPSATGNGTATGTAAPGATARGRATSTQFPVVQGLTIVLALSMGLLNWVV